MNRADIATIRNIIREELRLARADHADGTIWKVEDPREAEAPNVATPAGVSESSMALARERIAILRARKAKHDESQGASPFDRGRHPARGKPRTSGG